MSEFFIALSALSNVVLGILVYRKQPHDKTARLFFLFTLSAALWIITNLLWHISLTYYSLSLTYTTGVIFAFTGLLWSSALTKKSYSHFYLLYVLTLGLFVLTFLEDAIVGKFHGKFIGDYSKIKTGPFFVLYALYMLWVLMRSLYYLWCGYRNEHGLRKKQIKYVFLGSLIFVSIVLISDFLIPSIFNNFTFAFIDSSFSLILIGLTAYATLKYRLMDVQILLKKSFIYGAIALFSYGIFHLVAWSLLRFFGSLWSLPALMSGFFVALVFALLLPTVERLFVSIANNYLYANIYNAQSALQQLTNTIISMVKLHQIVNYIVAAIESTFNTSRIAFVITSPQFPIVKRKGFAKKFVRVFEEALPCLQQLNSIFLTDEIEYHKKQGTYPKQTLTSIEQLSQKTTTEVILPLYIKNKNLGIIFLGPKRANRAYVPEDIEVLDTMSKQGAIAIDNALLYQALREKNRRLQQLLEVQKEFLDITSHQLRTPISIIRGASSMILKNEEIILLKEAAPMIHEAAIRMNTVVDSLLIASKLDTPQFSLNRKKINPISLRQLIQKVIDSLQCKIQQKKLLVTSAIDDTLTVYAHPRYAEIALANLIENAIKYAKTPSNNGSIAISATTHGNHIRVYVKDNGIGVPKKEQGRIFEKFNRASNAKRLVPEGTGLGLFIVRKIMEAHPEGSYGLESTEGDGATFWVEFKTS